MAKRAKPTTSVKRSIVSAMRSKVQPRPGIEDFPKPGRSGAMRWKRLASRGIRSRNMWLALGKPCSSSSFGAPGAPASRKKMLQPSTSAVRYRMAVMALSLSGGEKSIERQRTRTSQHQREQAGDIQEIDLVSGWAELRPVGGHPDGVDRAEAVTRMDGE